MKTLRIITVALFIAVVLLPILFFNFEPNSVSEIDNRTLAENPFSADGDLTENIENYINDRIGFRDDLINGYTLLNDRLFGKMVHPSYKYGKDGYVFGNGITTSNNFGEYHIAFADMVKAVQDYCESRDVPFLFVFNPAKPAVYQDKLPEGVNYNRQWVAQFLEELDKRGVHYLDNTETMTQLAVSGIWVYNQMYDANHWNHTGAFYGTQKALEILKLRDPSVHVNTLSEFTFTQTLKTSLPVSNFPIHEYVPQVTVNTPFTNISSGYTSELSLDPSYQSFGYYVNAQRAEEGAPKALVFQGSYMNSYGYVYFCNSFSEYIYVHDYQNILNVPYYFNIFQPECVIFEVAEYTFADKYFSFKNMQAIDYNPALSQMASDSCQQLTVDSDALTYEKGNTLTKITWSTDTAFHYVWLEAGKVYDMAAVDGGYQITVDNKYLDAFTGEVRIYTCN